MQEKNVPKLVKSRRRNSFLNSSQRVCVKAIKISNFDKRSSRLKNEYSDNARLLLSRFVDDEYIPIKPKALSTFLVNWLGFVMKKLEKETFQLWQIF